MCLTTQRQREPNASVSNDAEAEEPNAKVSKDTEAKETQRQSVKRRGGEGNTTPTRRTMPKWRGPSDDDWGVEQSRLALFFIFTSFHVPTYKPKGDYPSLGTIYLFTTI